MRGTAALRGIDPNLVVPPKKWVIGVKVSPTPGIMQARFPTEGPSKKKYRYEVFATYTQLKTLMGQHALDRYLLGGDSNRWDVPKKIEREVTRKEKKGQGNQGPAENAGLVDDAPPASENQSKGQKESSGEDKGEKEKDAVTKAVEDMDKALSLEANTSDMEADD